MTHFGIVSPPVYGHIHPCAALGRELQSRGHRVTYFQLLDLAEKIRGEGLPFHPIGERDYPLGSLARALVGIGQRRGLAALRFTIGTVAETSAMLCRDLPGAIRQTGVEAMLIDQMEPAGGAVAEHLELPFFTICSALSLNRDPMVPPPFSAWRYRHSRWAAVRNRLGYMTSDWLTRSVRRVVATHRTSWGLPPLRSPDDSFSSALQISQLPRELDYPRERLPAHFHYVGPLRNAAPKAVAFPWDRLDGRPLVYASLGTLQNSREAVLRCIAEACRGLPVQLVISHGGGLSDQQAAALSGEALVVSYAPQTEVLARARLTVTHGGLNTVLDSLASGVPLVTIPITYEQPAIARRLERTGSGTSISLGRLNSGRLRRLILDVLDGPAYYVQAERLQEAIVRAGGAKRAADLVERALSPGDAGPPRAAVFGHPRD